MQSLVEENYLKALFNLSVIKGHTTVNELSIELDLTMPSVNSMVKKMAQKGLVNYEKYKPIVLTNEGTKQAGLIVRKHRLTEMFLVQVMGFGWEEVHDIAEQIEHIKSPIFFKKMDKMLGFPSCDPHGSPIPDEDGRIFMDDLKALAKLKTGDVFVLKSVINGSKDFLEFLNNKAIHLNVEMKVKNVELFDGSVTVVYNKQQEVLSLKVAENLLGKLN